MDLNQHRTQSHPLASDTKGIHNLTATAQTIQQHDTWCTLLGYATVSRLGGPLTPQHATILFLLRPVQVATD